MKRLLLLFSLMLLASACSWGATCGQFAVNPVTGFLDCVGTASTSTFPATVSGATSGGVACFTSATTETSSGALGANLPVIGGGSGVCPSTGQVSGNTTKFATVSGSLTNTHGVVIDANGNIIDSGGVPAGGTGNAGAPGTVSATSGAVTFTCPSATAGTSVYFNATLTGSITSSSVASCTPNSVLYFRLVQSAGGGLTWTAPAGFENCFLNPAANAGTKCSYVYDGTNGRLYPNTSDQGFEAGQEVAAPGTPPSGDYFCWSDSTNHIRSCKHNNSSTVSNLVVPSSAPTNNFATGISAAGVVSYARPSYANLSTDFSDVKYIPAANCNNTTAGAGWSIGSGGTVTCRAGTNNKGGFISITDTSTTFATFQVPIPEDWDASNNPYIRFQIASTDTTSGHTIIPSIQVACYKGDGSTTDDVAANAAHSLSTITTNTTANQFWSTSNVQMNGTDVTGCVAGALMQITVGRATDTSTNAEFYGATVTFPRAITVQAN